MNKEINIDSCKYRIPIKAVELIDKTLILGSVEISKATGEKIRETDKTTIGIKENGITVIYKVESQTVAGGGKKEFLTIGINSKMLKERYFEGITSENISLIYDYIISQNVVLFTFKDFLNGEITDVDFKQDFKMSEKGFIKIIEMLHNKTKSSGAYGKGSRQFKRKDNLGIQFSDRKTTNTTINPYIKFYYKTIELKSKSIDFNKAYLQNLNIDNIARVEFTIKNRKHFKKFNIVDKNGVTDSRLKTILALSQDKTKEMQKTIINTHLEKRQVIRKVKKGMKPVEQVFYILIIDKMETEQISFEMVLSRVLQEFKDKFAKSRMKKRLTKIYYDYILNTDLDKETKEIEEAFKIIGWD